MSTSTLRRSNRTRFVTGASILAVGVAGAIAIGANIGILDAAGQSKFGTLSAAGDLTASGPAISPTDAGAADPALADPTTTGPGPAATPVSQTFAIDPAGTVTVVATDQGTLRVDDAQVAPGWRWAVEPADPAIGQALAGTPDLRVVLTDGVRAFELLATLGPDGQITGQVTEAVVGSGSTFDETDQGGTTVAGGTGEHHERIEGAQDDD